jgi:hypothetical protein
MEIIKSTEEYTSCIVSADGVIHRYLSAKATEEEIAAAKKDIADYEKTAAGVLFTRLTLHGALSPVRCIVPKEGEKLTEEQSLLNQAVSLLDGVMDDGCCRADYFLFTPKTEEDVKDLCAYHKLTYSYSDIIFEPSVELSRYSGSCEKGEDYIYISNPDCEYGQLVSLSKFAKDVAKMCDVFEKLGKAQRKAN